MIAADGRATVLIFVQIPTHFQEQIRVAELLRTSGRYRPVVLIMAPYAGHEAHLRLCATLDVDCIGPDDLVTFLPPLPVRRRRRVPRLRASAALAAARSIGATVGRTSGWVARAGRRVATRAFTWLTTPMPVSRDVLRDGWAPRTLPRLAVAAAAGAARLAATALRPVLKPAVLAIFGLVYRLAPGRLPPDLRAQHVAWRLAPALVRALDVRVLVIPEDNFYYFTNLFVDAVRRHGGRSVIVPFTIVNTREWLEAFHRLPSHDARTPVNALTAALFPAWTRRYKSRDITMPAQQVLSNEYLRIAPPDPWLINSGQADAIAVESPFMERYYLQAGLDRARLRLVGALADDVLFAQRRDAGVARARLYGELGLPPGRDMVLCALPPNQLAGGGRPECEAESYEAVVDAFLRPLEALRDTHNIVISLHPRISQAEADIVRRHGRAVSSWNIAELVPLAGLYVASCSATIRLAMSCGIPTLNYDIYRYDYGDYDGVPGVQTMTRSDEYATAVKALTGPAGAAVARAMAAFDGKPLLDGRAGERLLALIDELADSAAATGRRPAARGRPSARDGRLPQT